VDALAFEKPRTKDMLATLSDLELSGKTLIVIDRKDENLQRSANNLPGVKTLLASYLNVRDLLSYDTVLMSRAAVDVVEGYLGQGAPVAEDDQTGEEA
jgi:large subunit ribosomal protein L4